MRRALIIGINDYEWGPLKGCIPDANNMAAVLSKHYDDSPNFSCKVLTSDKTPVTRSRLMKSIDELFKREGDLALLYFSGHGAENNLGGYLVTQDARKYDQGISVNDVISLAIEARHIRQVFIILDCCHSGHLGNLPVIKGETALLRKGMSILTASQHNEYAVERNGQGLFTKTILAGFNGGAADILGNVTAASLYNYSDKLLGPWEQRPTFKSHVTEMTSLRSCNPTLSFPLLRKLAQYFDREDHLFPLDPSFEPQAAPKNTKNEGVFKNLQKFVSAGLVAPVGEEHMYYAALNGRSCQLTPLGKLYWNMAKNQRI